MCDESREEEKGGVCVCVCVCVYNKTSLSLSLFLFFFFFYRQRGFRFSSQIPKISEITGLNKKKINMLFKKSSSTTVLLLVLLFGGVRSENPISHQCETDSDCKDLAAGTDRCDETSFCVPTVGPIAGHRRCGQCTDIDSNGYCQGNQDTWTNSVCTSNEKCKSFGQTGAGFCDRDFFQKKLLRGGGECENPHNLKCVKLPGPVLPWNHNGERSKVTTSSGEDLYLNYPTSGVDGIMWSEKTSTCEQEICGNQNVERMFKKDQYGNFVKAFECENPCHLTCELHRDEYNAWVGFTMKDKMNSTIFLDEDLNMNEMWWNPLCPVSICDIYTLRRKFVRRGRSDNDGMKDAAC